MAALSARARDEDELPEALRAQLAFGDAHDAFTTAFASAVYVLRDAGAPRST